MFGDLDGFEGDHSVGRPSAGIRLMSFSWSGWGGGLGGTAQRQKCPWHHQDSPQRVLALVTWPRCDCQAPHGTGSPFAARAFGTRLLCAAQPAGWAVRPLSSGVSLILLPSVAACLSFSFKNLPSSFLIPLFFTQSRGINAMTLLIFPAPQLPAAQRAPPSPHPSLPGTDWAEPEPGVSIRPPSSARTWVSEDGRRVPAGSPQS